MKGKIIGFCFLAIFLLLVSSSASAVEYSNVKETVKDNQINIISLWKEKSKSATSEICPSVKLLLVWMALCSTLFIGSWIKLKKTPVVYAVISQLLFRMYVSGVARLSGAEPPPYSIVGFLRASPEEQYAQINLFLVSILNISLRVFLINLLFRSRST